MPHIFKRIGIIGKQRDAAGISSGTLQQLLDYFKDKPYHLVVDSETAVELTPLSFKVVERDQLGQACDLVIVVGGDGSLLSAARAVVDAQVPVIGINRGRLGFLTDIRPDEVASRLDEILAGHFQEEQRFLLTATIFDPSGAMISTSDALNDVVLMPGAIAHMIEFEIYIDQQFVCSQRADGLIMATPTGSTAYALSGGGPILYPQLDAVVLVPMFPHTLTSRPIVVDGNCQLVIQISEYNDTEPQVSCDGQACVSLTPGSQIHITKKPTRLRLLHPLDYHYFDTLRAKLHWGTKL